MKVMWRQVFITVKRLSVYCSFVPDGLKYCQCVGEAFSERQETKRQDTGERCLHKVRQQRSSKEGSAEYCRYLRVIRHSLNMIYTHW